jgi:hypothetical protein
VGHMGTKQNVVNLVHKMDPVSIQSLGISIVLVEIGHYLILVRNSRFSRP